MVSRVANEDAGERPRGKFVTCCGDHVGEASAAEDAKFSVGWRRAEEQLERRR